MYLVTSVCARGRQSKEIYKNTNMVHTFADKRGPPCQRTPGGCALHDVVGWRGAGPGGLQCAFWYRLRCARCQSETTAKSLPPKGVHMFELNCYFPHKINEQLSIVTDNCCQLICVSGPGIKSQLILTRIQSSKAAKSSKGPTAFPAK